MAWEHCCIGRGVAAIRHRSGSRSYTYQSILSIQGELVAFEHTGTVFGSINKAQFENLRILAPEEVMVKAFEDVAGPMDDQIRANESEIKTLIELRDLLLPKLMSGEIRLRDAENVVEHVL
jgi:type I restriction enzyme S subunit